MSETKVCRKCGIAQPLKAFSPYKAAKDRLAYWCMTCKVAATKAGPNRSVVLQAYRDRNKEVCAERVARSIAKKAEYYAEQGRERARKERTENREQLLARRRACYAKNPEKEIARTRIRKKRMSTPPAWLTLGHHAEMEGLYIFCKIFKGFEVDHIIPLNGKKVTGLHVPENLQVLTRSENRRKGAKFPFDDRIEAVVDDPRGITRV